MNKMSTREGIHVGIAMTPQGKIYLKVDPYGEFMIYKDQASVLEAIVSSCKTRDEARERMYNFNSGYDFHHSNDRKVQAQKQRPQTPRNGSKSKPQNRISSAQNTSSQLRIVTDSDDIREIQ